MEDRLLDKIAEPFNLNLPEYASMEEMIDNLLPVVGKFSDPSLADENAAIYKVDWVKMTDVPGVKVVSLHTFMTNGQVRIADDGKIGAMSFEVLNSRRVIVGQSIHREAYLYELAFMDNDFLILKRHGNEANFQQRDKYLFFCREAIGTRLEWHEALEQIADKYRNNNFPWWIVLVVLVIVVGALAYLR